MTKLQIPSFVLSNGVEIPALGLGTFPMSKKNASVTVGAAEKIGYRLFDTSSAYGNEAGIGKALWKESFVTTKISNRSQKRGTVWLDFQKSRIRLRRGVIDLVLLHWPYPEKFSESWAVLEGFYRRGACRAIGVSNFKIHHLEELRDTAKIMPMVNQFERHPMYSQSELVEYCKENNIIPEAYTPFARMDARLIDDERVCKIASHHQKKPTQIILRWNYQHGVIAIPKSESPKRMEENASIFDFELSEAEMGILDSMDCGMRVRYDSDNCDFDQL